MSYCRCACFTKCSHSCRSGSDFVLGRRVAPRQPIFFPAMGRTNDLLLKLNFFCRIRILRDSRTPVENAGPASSNHIRRARLRSRDHPNEVGVHISGIWLHRNYGTTGKAGGFPTVSSSSPTSAHTEAPPATARAAQTTPRCAASHPFLLTGRSATGSSGS